jgi:transcriptional regulator with XRE-family HTH domain
LTFLHHLLACKINISCFCRFSKADESVITATQLRAARVLLGLDQRQLAELSGLSVPTIQRMEASETMVRGNVDSLMKLINALDLAGIEIIHEGAVSGTAGRGVRLKSCPDMAAADAGGRSNLRSSRPQRAHK